MNTTYLYLTYYKIKFPEFKKIQYVDLHENGMYIK